MPLRRSSGLTGLDETLNQLRIGDNVVWQVDNIEDFKIFVTPFVRQTLRKGQKLVYMRFAEHEPLVEDQIGVVKYQLDATSGFETFSTQVHDIISREGRNVFYVFDCLSNLLSAWATDLMIGNFFTITCPYLY